jgi:hypothetical protein
MLEPKERYRYERKSLTLIRVLYRLQKRLISSQCACHSAVYHGKFRDVPCQTALDRVGLAWPCRTVPGRPGPQPLTFIDRAWLGPAQPQALTFIDRAWASPAPKPPLLSTGPWASRPPSPHFHRQGPGQPGPQPLTSIGQPPHFY